MVEFVVVGLVVAGFVVAVDKVVVVAYVVMLLIVLVAAVVAFVLVFVMTWHFAGLDIGLPLFATLVWCLECALAILAILWGTY